MARHNAYVKPKVRKQTEPTAFETKELRIQRVMDYMKYKKETSYDDLQRFMEFGDGVMYSVMSAVKQRYPNIIRWNKKTKLYTHIAIKQEVKN